MGRTFRFVAVFSGIALMAGMFILSCGGGGGGGGSGGGGGGGGVAALSFDNTTSLPAGGGAGLTSVVFAQFGLITANILNALSGGAGGGSLAAHPMAPVPIPGFCLNEPAGSATVDWNDPTGVGAGVLSDDDTVTLALDNCTGSLISFAPANGTIIFDIESVSGAIPVIGGIISANTNLNLTITEDGFTTGISGDFPLDANIPLTLLLVNLTLGGFDNNAIITVTENDVTVFEFACFNIFQRVSLGSVFVDLFRPVGVANLADTIYTINSYTVPPDAIGFDFTSGDPIPISGTIDLFSGDLSNGICSDFSGDPVADNSFVMVTFTGGGNVTLDGEDADGNFFVINTTWDALLDSL
jgi:hypothetical protein